MAIRSDGATRLGKRKKKAKKTKKSEKKTCLNPSRKNSSSKKEREKENILKGLCQKWDSNPRPHTWTRTLSVRRNLQKELNLESGALDRSAILTTDTSWKNRTSNRGLNW